MSTAGRLVSGSRTGMRRGLCRRNVRLQVARLSANQALGKPCRAVSVFRLDLKSFLERSRFKPHLVFLSGLTEQQLGKLHRAATNWKTLDEVDLTDHICWHKIKIKKSN